MRGKLVLDVGGLPAQVDGVGALHEGHREVEQRLRVGRHRVERELVEIRRDLVHARQHRIVERPQRLHAVRDQRVVALLLGGERPDGREFLEDFELGGQGTIHGWAIMSSATLKWCWIGSSCWER